VTHEAPLQYSLGVLDFTPGQPIDRRPPERQRKQAASYLGDFEGAAARVVARLTGNYVEIYDDGSSRSMPDLKIVDRSGKTAFGEVTQDVDSAYAALGNEVLKRRYEVAAPTLRRIWWVTLTPDARVNDLVRALPRALNALDADGDVFEHVELRQRLQTHPNPTVRSLAESGVERLASRSAARGEEGLIRLGVVGTGGAVGQDWPGFQSYLAEFLKAQKLQDVRTKLGRTGADERHAFVGLSFTTPWPVYHTLSDEYTSLPPGPPNLPQEITHLWVWAYPLGRCVVWSPNQGWIDPRSHWTAP
jgi:hypothetical protein